MQGRHVVITGASGALGAGVVEVLLARGAVVHAPTMEASWRGDPRVDARPGVHLDDEAQVTAYYASLRGVWASIHLVGGFAMAPILETTLAQLEAQWRINTVTCFLACREAVRAGAQRIVNVAARPALTPAANMTAYAAGKAGVASITEGLAAELVGKGVLVNAIVPSLIDTPANRAAMPAADHAAWPKPAELAEAIAFLASPANSLTSGALIPVYGRM